MANINTINLNGSTFETRPYGTCSTGASTAAKTVSLTGFEYFNGASIVVKFNNANTAANPTLNVNSKGAKSIRWNGTAFPSSQNWTAGAVIEFVYDGEYWNMMGAIKDNDTLFTESYKGTVTSITPGTGLTGTTKDEAITSSGTINLKTASINEIGGIKTGFTVDTANKNYPVVIDGSGNAYVNVPWAEVTEGTLPELTAYKKKQTAVSDPTASTTTSTTFIDTISQDANGVITATKKTVGIPTSLPATGGNADTVDNKHASDFMAAGDISHATHVPTGGSANQVLAKNASNNGYTWVSLPTTLPNPNAISFKNASGTVVSYDGSSALDLTGGIYYAATAGTATTASALLHTTALTTSTINQFFTTTANSGNNSAFRPLRFGIPVTNTTHPLTSVAGWSVIDIPTNITTLSTQLSVQYNPAAGEVPILSVRGRNTSTWSNWTQLATVDMLSGLGGADTSDCVKLTGNQSISGTKTFNNDIIVNGKVSASDGFYETSDERLKNFSTPIDIDLDKLSNLTKSYFTWKDSNNIDRQLGVSAQEIRELYPEIVTEDKDGNLQVAYDKLSVVALAAIDQLHDENKALKNNINNLEERLAKVEALLNKN